MSSSSFSAQADASPVATTRRIIVCVGMALFIVLAIIGLRFAPVPTGAQSLAYTPPKVPEARLRFVWLDARRARIADTTLVARLRKLAPDYLLAENIDSAEVKPLASALQMEQSLAPQLFQPTRASAEDHGSFGVCAMSKYPFFDAEPLKRSGINFGVSVFSVVQGRKFMLAAVCMNDGADRDADAAALIAYWRQNGCPPFVGTGVFNKEIGNGALVQPATGWFDGLTPFEQIAPSPAGAPGPRPARIMFTQGWSCVAGGFDASPGGQSFAWVDATSAHVVATTSATTAPSDRDDDP